MGINWVGIVFGLGAVISMGYWTTDFLVVQRVISAKDLRSAKLAPIIGAAFKMCVPFIVILPGLLGLAVLPGTPGAAKSQAVATGGHSYNEVLPIMLARYCGPGLLGLGITALIAGFMSGMAGNVSAFATVWTYDIYRAMFRKNATDAHYVSVGRWCTILGVLAQHRHRLPGDELRQHHGLRAGAVQLLHRAPVRHRAARHALEARHPGRRILGPGGGHRLLHRHVGLGQNRSHRAFNTSRMSPNAKDMAENMFRALWSWHHLRGRHRRGQPDDRSRSPNANWSAWSMAAPRSRRKATCPSGSARSSGPASWRAVFIALNIIFW